MHIFHAGRLWPTCYTKWNTSNLCCNQGHNADHLMEWIRESNTWHTTMPAKIQSSNDLLFFSNTVFMKLFSALVIISITLNISLLAFEKNPSPVIPTCRHTGFKLLLIVYVPKFGQHGQPGVTWLFLIFSLENCSCNFYHVINCAQEIKVKKQQ